MAVEQIRPVEGQRKAAQRKTPELNVDTAITILFGTSRLEGDSFISTLRYARNEGMLEPTTRYTPEETGLIWRDVEARIWMWRQVPMSLSTQPLSRPRMEREAGRRPVREKGGLP